MADTGIQFTPDPTEDENVPVQNINPSTPINFVPEGQTPAIAFSPDKVGGPIQHPADMSNQSNIQFTPDATTSAVNNEIQNRSFFNRPALRAEETRPEEIQAIATKHGVDPDQLQQLAPYFGARMQGKLPQEATGYAGELALGIPQKLYKMAQSPEMERALDDVQALSSGRESYAGLAGQIATPVIPGLGAGATLGAKLAHGAVIGGLAGAAGARQGQILEGGVVGAGFGAALGLVADKLMSRAGNRTEQTVVQDVIRSAAPDIDKGGQEILDSQSASLPVLQEHILTRTEPGVSDLSRSDVESVLREQVDPDAIATRTDPSTSEGKLTLQRAYEEMPEIVQAEGDQVAMQRVVAQDILDKKTEDFAEFLTGKDPKTTEEAISSIQDYAHTQGGQQALEDRWRNFTTEDAAEKYIAQSHIRPGRESDFLNKALNHVSDAQFTLRDMDNRMHLGIEPIHNELNTNYNRMTLARQGFEKDLDSVFRQAQSSGVDKEIVNSPKLFRAIDSGNFSGLSPEEIDIANRFRDYFNKGLQFVNDTVAERDPTISPLSIPKRENYVPYQVAPVRELESRVTTKLNTANLAALTNPTDFHQALLANPDLQDVMELLGRIDRTGEARTGPELMAKVHDIFQTRDGRNALETMAQASLERGKTPLPEWARETNLYQLANNWINSTLRHLYLRDPIEKMAGKMRTLRRSGAELEAGYVQNLLSDMQGNRAGTMSALTASGGDKFSRAIDNLVGGSTNPGVQAAAGVAKALPAIVTDLSRNIYANVLGLSAHADILHILHPLVKTLPEIGTTPYGVYAFTKGAVRSLAQFSDYAAKVHTQGLVPAEMIPKFRQAVEEGIRRNSLYAVPQGVVQKMGEVAMYTFRKLDIMNRMITTAMADTMIEDLGRGSSAAQSALRKLPTDIQRYIGAAAGNTEEQSRRLSVYLNASTSYNYNRASLSEFGRTMGPFFSTFTKWPTATAGEIISEYRDKGFTAGTLRNAEKFVAPLLVLKGMDALIKAKMGDNGEFSDREKMFLGHGGLSAAAPLGSIHAIASGHLFAPPLVDTVMRGIVEPIKTGDAAKFRGAMIGAMQEFAPGAAYVRFLTDDLVTYIKGQRPEGTNFIERTQSGANTINRMGGNK